MPLNRLLKCFRAILLIAPLASSAAAEAMPPPSGPVILSVSGPIALTNGDGVLQLDEELFATLPQHSFTTSTIWTKGSATYSGVPLRDLLLKTGVTRGTVRLTALNDYQISMPVHDAMQEGPLLANLVDGQPMSVRDKGPIWLIYPYDDVASFRTEQTYGRSIWQLTRIEIIE